MSSFGSMRIGMRREVYEALALWKRGAARYAGDGVAAPQAREAGARRWAAREVGAQPGEYCARELVLMRAAGESFLFGRIRDVSGLDQHGGDVRRLQHYEPCLLYLRLAHFAHAIEREQDPLGGDHAGADVRGLGKIEQHRGERVVFERDAAHEVCRVLALGEPARRFVRRSAL